MKNFPPIYALFCQIMSRQTFTHFLTVCQKNPQHDRVKPRGGIYTLCKKTSDLVAFLRMMKMICWKASAAHPKEGELEITFDGNFFFEDDDRDNDMDGQ